jgi:hypothetical protein
MNATGARMLATKSGTLNTMVKSISEMGAEKAIRNGSANEGLRRAKRRHTP